jgi:opacity protein-like surface antigen
MLNHMKVLVGITTLSSSIVFAGAMGPVDSFKPSAYVKLGSGGSYSMDARIFADPAFWDASPQGYNGTVNNTALYSAAFGYNYSPLISTDIEYIYRPSYSYSKFQTSTASTTPGFIGDTTRHFNLQSNSLMANLYVHGAGISDYLKMNVKNIFSIEPFIGGGLGVAFNTVSNFNSLESTGTYSSVEQDNFRTALAWQLSAGLQLINDSHFNLAAGYRYYNGEDFTSNNYTFQNPTFATPWKGTVAANEFFVTLAYKLDA